MIRYGSFDKGVTPPMEYIKGKAGETYTVGEALVIGVDGAPTKCGATTVPAYICVGGAMENGNVPCTRVQKDIVYDAPMTADGAGLKLGNKVTLSADGLGVTATIASGVAEIVRMDGTAIGDTVGVRF